MLQDNVNPPDEGTVDAHVQRMLEKSEQRTPEEAEEEPAEQEPKGKPDDAEETEDETEAADDEGEVEDTEAEEEAEDTEDDDEPQKFTVKIDGKDVQVTLDEALAGYMKDQDYRKKTTEVADLRRQVEAEKQTVSDLSNVRENYLNEITTLKGIVASFVIPDTALDNLLKSGKSEDYLRAKAQNEKIQQQINALDKKQEAVENEVTEEQSKQIESRKLQERESLFNAMPDLKSDANQKVLGEYMLGLGFNADDIANTLDHRLFVMAEKARRFDAQQARTKDKPVVKVPKVIKGKEARKSGAEIQQGKLRELRSKAQRSGSREDHVAYLLEKQSAKGT